MSSVMPEEAAGCSGRPGRRPLLPGLLGRHSRRSAGMMSRVLFLRVDF